MLLLSRKLLRPFPRVLLELLAVALVLIRYGRLDSIIRVWLDQKVPRHVDDRHELVRRLPLVAAKHAQAHGAFVIVTDVRVVDLGLEVQDWRLEGVVFGEREEELEVTALWTQLAVIRGVAVVEAVLRRLIALAHPTTPPIRERRIHRQAAPSSQLVGCW